MTTSTRLLLLGALVVAGCDKQASTAAPAEPSEPASPAEATVVPNLEADPGDTTICPYSGRAFVVKAEHPKVDYEGKSYWVCSEEAAEKVRADPDKYFADFEG